MDTKWKKWKVPVSFLVFVLGVALLLGGGLLAAGRTVVSLNGGGSPLSDVFQQDYQQTGRFRVQLSNMLEEILRIVQAGDEASLDERYGAEKNLLVGAVRDGELLYANGAAEGWSASGFGALPEGYNFTLILQDGRCTVTKDGTALEIYGDGYFRDGDWRLPGYENYKLGAEYDGISVALACRAEPVKWMTPQTSGWDSLYRLTVDLKSDRVMLIILYALPMAGLALFIWYICWRRYKKAADVALAGVTGRIWLEFKLLLLPLLGLLLMGAVGVSLNILRYGVGYATNPLVTWLLIPVGPVLTYLYLNDLRYNGLGVFRSSFCAAVSRLFRRGGMDLPVQRRTLRRVRLAGAAMLPFVLASALGGLLLTHRAVAYRAWGVFLLMLLLCLTALALLYLLYRLFLQERSAAEDLGALADQLTAVRAGALTEALVLPEESDLLGMAEDLNDLQRGMEAAITQRMKSERMKVELVANVSHDLKTPLTSILSYADLLAQEEGLPDHVADYIRVVNEKALRLKTMVQEVFEISKAASGDLPVRMETLDLSKLLRQTLADMDEAVTNRGLVFKIDLPGEPVFISADGDRLYRVFQNLIQNALQYALDGTRVYVTVRTGAGRATASVKNTSREALPADVDFTERFVRGDESRTDGGGGLGLAIAGSFTRACGGTFRVTVDADLFTAEVQFPLAPPPPPGAE